MKRWRRSLILIALLLLAGAVVNVAVAWYWAATVSAPARPPDWGAPPVTAFELALLGGSWGDALPQFHIGLQEAGSDVMRGTATLSAGCTLAFEACGSTGVPDGGFESNAWTLGAGWPWVAMRVGGQHGSAARSSLPLLAAGVRAPLLPGRDWFTFTGGRAPIDPVFPGFAINTLFYAVVVGAILALPLSVFPIRRRLRARRGRCARCGYDLAGLGDGGGPCPECGAG